MPMIAALLLLAAQTVGGMTVAEVKALPPERAGERLLEGRTHSRIETIVKRDEHMAPPGFVYYELTEAPVAIAGGCARQKWTATFRIPASGTLDSAVLFSDPTAVQEVALPMAKGCAAARYVHLNPGVQRDAGLIQLRLLQEIVTGKRRVIFGCSAVKGPDFCTSRKTIRTMLASQAPWALSSTRGFAEFWLGERGQLVTIVKFDPGRPSHVSVVRQPPYPF